MKREDAQTLSFYKKNAEKYSRYAFTQQEVKIREMFMNMLPYKGTILDFGCGPGYDAYAFSKKKFLVTALDGVNEFAEIAKNKFKLELRVECFSKFREERTNFQITQDGKLEWERSDGGTARYVRVRLPEHFLF